MSLVEVNSFEDLFKNRLKIKSAIARANIDTKISLLDTEYSIIELQVVILGEKVVMILFLKIN
jgi:hypothetical protein